MNAPCELAAPVALLAVLLTQAGPCGAATPAPLNTPTPIADWESYNNTYDGQRYSPLKQINTGNVAGLKEKCRVVIARRGAFETGPVVVAGTMYVTTAFDTVAVDPVTCEVRWIHTEPSRAPPALPVNRGIAYLDGRVFRGTVDARLIALDAATGRLLWSDTVGDPGSGTLVTGAPVAWNGLVFAGVSISELGIKGRVMAVDASSGREVWRFNTIPTGKEAGADSWANRDSAQTGGGGTWSTFALDVDAAEIFIPVGNPVPDLRPADRPGANLFTDSVVVLDARTGVLKWWYQLVSHDGQDRDLGASPMLFKGTRSRQLVAAAGKDGYLHVIDGTSRRLLYKTPVTTISNADKTVPTTSGLRICPGVVGGVEWNGPAFDRVHQTIVVGAVDWCSIVTADESATVYGAGEPRIGGTFSVPTDETATGWVTAVDASTGAVRWRYHADAPVVAGVTATAGGLVLTGDNAGNFVALDSATGTLLKKIPTGGALAGGVVTYEQNQQQYVAFASGSVSRTLYGGLGRPSIVILETQTQTESTAESVRSSPDTTRGHDLFLQTCSGCHGMNGGQLRNYDLKQVRSRLSQEQLETWIKNPAPPMPKVFPEPLDRDDERDVRDIAAYVLSF